MRQKRLSSRQWPVSRQTKQNKNGKTTFKEGKEISKNSLSHSSSGAVMKLPARRQLSKEWADTSLSLRGSQGRNLKQTLTSTGESRERTKAYKLNCALQSRVPYLGDCPAHSGLCPPKQLTLAVKSVPHRHAHGRFELGNPS